MSDLILYNYPLSPFSEKIRLMLGYSELPWRSLAVPEMPPRPALAKLAAGYRKIPVAQLGADIFCDTRIIASEIAGMSGRGELAPEQASAEAQAHAAHSDLEFFLACVLSSGTAAMWRRVREDLGWGDIARFVADRLRIGRASKVRGLSLKTAARMVPEQLAAMEARLEGDFLFGRSPCYADFSSYHPLWILHDLARHPLPRDYPRVMGWMDRMRALGHGRVEPISQIRATEWAAQSTPREIPQAQREDPDVGTAVAIAPSDYARDTALGQLVGVSPTRWIIAHESEALGRIHVHFPRQGYVLS